MTDVRKTIYCALQMYRGDNLARARHAWKSCTPAQMQETYGHSGRTRAAILADYEQHEADIDAALRWLEAHND